MRRVILEDPLARSALWSRNIALFALVVALIGILLAHKGLEARAALAVEGGALALAALAVLCALVAMVVIWRTGFRGIGLALGGLALAAVLFAYPSYLAATTRDAPGVIDASTDLADPPSFLKTVAANRARHGYVPPATMSKADAALQARLYPDLQTLDLDANSREVEEELHKLIKRRKWTIVDEIRPENFATGHIDMVVKSGLMGFPSDVTVRIRGIGERTRIDIRSASRSPWLEQPGANAARVQALADDLEDAIGEG